MKKKNLYLMLALLALLVSVSKGQRTDCLQGFNNVSDPRNPYAKCLEPIGTMLAEGAYNDVTLHKLGDLNKDGIDDWIIMYWKTDWGRLPKLFYGVKGRIPKFSEGIDICDTSSRLQMRFGGYGDYDQDGNVDIVMSYDKLSDTSYGNTRYRDLSYVVVYWGPSYSTRDSVRLGNGYDAWLGARTVPAKTDVNNDGVDDILMWGGISAYKQPNLSVELPFVMMYLGEKGKRWGRDKSRLYDKSYWNIRPIGTIGTSIVRVIDQDGDGYEDYINYGGRGDGRLIYGILYGRQGNLPDSLERQEFDMDSLGWYDANIFDVTGDGFPELLVGKDGELKIYAGVKGERLKEIYGKGEEKATPNSKHWWNKPWASIWSCYRINPVWQGGPGVPDLGDIDLDGIHDIWGGGGANYSFVYTAGVEMDSLADAIYHGVSDGRADLGDILGNKKWVLAVISGRLLTFLEPSKDVPGNIEGKRRKLPHESVGVDSEEITTGKLRLTENSSKKKNSDQITTQNKR